MKYPKVRVLFDRKKQSCDTRQGRVEVEISHERKRKWISTGVAVLPRQWDSVKWVVRHPDSGELNMRIEAVRRPIADYISLLMVKGEEFSFERMEVDLARKKVSESFADFARERIESRTDIREITRRNHRRLLNALSGFGRIETFDDLTPQTIRDFDDWLHGQGYVQTTVATYHKFMKNYINDAIGRGLMTTNPYAGMRVDKGKYKQRKFLTEEELEAVRNLKMEEGPVTRARDLFLFQCFTGLAYADLAKFDFASVTERDGKYVVRDVRQKSEEEFYIVLMTPAVEILRRYGMKLPVISNQKYNATLKAVAAGAGLGRNLTSHMGRHTFATYCINHGVPIEVLATMLGHTNIKATQIYARMVNKTVESAFEELEKLI